MCNHQSTSNLRAGAHSTLTLGAPALALVLGVFLAATTAAAQSSERVAEETTRAVETGDLRSDSRVIASRVGLSPVDLSRDPLAQPPRYQERPTGEWQGMRVDLNVRQACKKSDQCGNALACIRGVCSPCRTDAQCGKGSICALDHCVLEENTSCRQRVDCGGVDGGDDVPLCMLSGYSHTPRGNEEMQAFCAVPSGGTAQSQEDHERLLSTLDARSVKIPVPVDVAALLADVEQHLADASSGEEGVEIIDPYYIEGGIDPVDATSGEDGVEIIDPYYIEGGIDPVDATSDGDGIGIIVPHFIEGDIGPIDPEGDTRGN